MVDQRIEKVVDEPLGAGGPCIQVDGADQSLHGVGQDGRLVAATSAELATSQLDHLADRKPSGDRRQTHRAHHFGAQLGQLPLGQIGMAAVQVFGDDDTEHGVTQELQPFVGRNLAVLVGERPMGQRQIEELGIQLNAELLDQRNERR